MNKPQKLCFTFSIVEDLQKKHIDKGIFMWHFCFSNIAEIFIDNMLFDANKKVIQPVSI